MKVLSIVVPCYNSAAYLERCVNSLLLGEEKVEVILIDDGSTDQTGEKVDYYMQRFPERVKSDSSKLTAVTEQLLMRA
uniref:Glycos_transf_2 n=1 Tax=uncultured Lactobacillus sp. TaxID=153152 RepID=A0A060BI69_9LACO|nr:Glycos_transf_2 [uncultured Lactobacillus sp.]